VTYILSLHFIFIHVDYFRVQNVEESAYMTILIGGSHFEELVYEKLWK